MSQQLIAAEADGFEDSTVTCIARVKDTANNLITVASLAAPGGITFSVTQIDDITVVTTSGSLVVADVVFDVLKTDPIWTVDPNQGYNFLHELTPAAFPLPKSYKIEYKFTDLNLKVSTVVFIYNAQDVLSS